jgi:hypothetical protein
VVGGLQVKNEPFFHHISPLSFQEISHIPINPPYNMFALSFSNSQARSHLNQWLSATHPDFLKIFVGHPKIGFQIS